MEMINPNMESKENPTYMTEGISIKNHNDIYQEHWTEHMSNKQNFGQIPEQNDTSDKRNLLDKYKEQTGEDTPDDTKELLREATAGRMTFIMVACLFLHFSAGGTAIALGVIYVDLIQVFDAPHAQAALVQSIFIGTLAGGGVIFAGVLQRYGPGIPVIMASTIAGMAFLAGSFAQNVPTLIVLIGVLGGLSLSINYLAAYVTVGWVFHKNRKTALAVITLGWTFGQILFPYISQFLIDNFRWNGSLIIISGFLLNCIPCGVLTYSSRDFFLISKPSTTSFRETLYGCITDYLFVLFLTIVFLYSSFATVETSFIPDMTLLKGFDRSIGAILLSILGICGFIGRIIGAVFLRVFSRIEALGHAPYAILFYGIGHFLVGYYNQLWGITLGVVVRGVFAGLTMAIMPGGQIELRGVERYPQTVAICNLVSGVAQILGGFLGGATVDLTGSYFLIFTLAAIMFFVCSFLLIIVWCLSKRRQKRETFATFEVKTDDENLNERTPLTSSLSHCYR